MKPTEISIGAFVAAAGLGMAVAMTPVSAQMNPIIMAGPQNNAMGRVMALRAKEMEESARRDEQRRQAPASRYAQAVTQQQLQDAAIAPLLPEFNRRAREDGAESAINWATAAGHALGREVVGLMPQYRQRVSSEGQAAANDWYLDAARAASLRYIQTSKSAH